MSRQWLRKVELQVADANGQGLDLSELRIRFEVRQGDTQTPNNAFIRVYNPSDLTAARGRHEFKRVTLRAGYEGSFGTIFEGTIKQGIIGRENPTDTFLDLYAADGDIGYNWGACSFTLAAGSTAADIIARMIRLLGQSNSGVRLGYVPDPLPELRAPRARVFHGMIRDVLRMLAETMGMSWSIQNGLLNFVPLTGTLPGNTVVLNSATGMIGMPRQTADGISARCLLNPTLRVAGQVKIDNASITRQAPIMQYVATPEGTLPSRPLVKVVGDGLYKLLVVEHLGDTRGGEWYSEFTCHGVNEPLPTAYVQAQRI